LLSASATKRGIYLLPLLPLLFLLLAAQAAEWWQRQVLPLGSRPGWWLQAALIVTLAITPTLVGLLYLRSTDPLALIFLGCVAAITVALVVFARRGERTAALASLATQALAGVVGLLLVTAHLAAPQKDMRPFVEWLDAQVPSGQPIYALGDLDETLFGIVPFVTGREVESVTAADIAAEQPPYVLVQDKEGGRTAPELGPPYQRLRDRSFGPGRYFAIWRNTDVATTR